MSNTEKELLKLLSGTEITLTILESGKCFGMAKDMNGDYIYDIHHNNIECYLDTPELSLKCIIEQILKAKCKI